MAALELRAAVRAFLDNSPSRASARGTTADELRWTPLACQAAVTAWDFDAWAALSTGYLELVRHAQALTALPSALNTLATTRLLMGNFASAAALFEEAGAAGSQLPSYGTAVLAAWQGRDARAAALMDATVKRAVAQGDGTAVAAMHWATAVLCNALGLYEDALAAAEQASRHPHDMWASLAWPELIEAAIRSGQAPRAGGADMTA